jgi:hypothetical protein
VTEFQNRGNEHDHALLWIEGAPVYGVDNNLEIKQFVDKYITCNTDHLEPDLGKFHRHYHTRSCRKRKSLHCRYNFLVPPIKATRIIEPVSLEDSVVVEKSKSLFTFLEQGGFDEMMSFDAFLTQANLSEYEYIQAIQIMLRQLTFFLKQKISHIWNNSFSKDMQVLWKENIDAQYMLNAYAATFYCTLYMMNIDKSMTFAFRKIRKEHERSHIDAIQMIQTLCNTFLNIQKMSTQKAVHIALSLPLTCCSRKCVFINTSPPEKHTFMLKPPILLQQEPENLEDVICLSIIDYYIQHPYPIRHICLAKFVSHYKKNGTPISKRKNPLLNGLSSTINIVTMKSIVEKN